MSSVAPSTDRAPVHIVDNRDTVKPKIPAPPPARSRLMPILITLGTVVGAGLLMWAT